MSSKKDSRWLDVRISLVTLDRIQNIRDINPHASGHRQPLIDRGRKELALWVDYSIIAHLGDSYNFL